MVLSRHFSGQEQDERFYDPLVTQDKEKGILLLTGTSGVATDTPFFSLHKHAEGKFPKYPVVYIFSYMCVSVTNPVYIIFLVVPYPYLQHQR